MAAIANSFYTESVSAPSPIDETVVGVHGIFGNPTSLQFIVSGLKKEGREIINWGYPSRSKMIEQHGADLVQKVLRAVAEKHPGKPIHFVVHSMGGLVLRAALSHPDCPQEAKMGKAVLLGTPNKSPSWGRYLGQFELPKKFGGIAGQQLMSQEGFDSIGELPSTVDALVIAGSAGINPFISGENDGTVAVEETHLKTPHRHIVLKTGHKLMLLDRKVRSAVAEFLYTSKN